MFSEVALGLVFTMPVTHCVSYLSRGSKVPKIYRIKTIMMYYCSWFSGLASQCFRWYVLSHSCYCRQRLSWGCRVQGGLIYMSGPCCGLWTRAPGLTSMWPFILASSQHDDSAQGYQGSKKACPSPWRLIKPLFVSHLLMSNWLKQVTWSNPE